MPKLKQSDRQIFFNRLGAYINWGMSLKGIKVPEVSISARVTPQNLYHKLRHPEEFRLKEIIGIFEKLDLSFEEFMNMRERK